MPTFTPRTTKEGMSSPSSPYNDIHYVGGLTTNHNSNKYNYNNAYTYQCTYYCLGRLGEMSGEPVQTFSIAPNPNVKHRLFSRSGFGDGKSVVSDLPFLQEEKFSSYVDDEVAYLSDDVTLVN